MPKFYGSVLLLVSVLIFISVLMRQYVKLKIKSKTIIKQTKCVTQPKLDHNEEFDGDVRWIIEPEDDGKNGKS